jgi:hypothetical protein
MNHLERTCGAQQMADRRAKGLADGDQKRGPKPFTTGEDTPANGGVNALRRCRWFGDEAIKFRVDCCATRRKELWSVN